MIDLTKTFVPYDQLDLDIILKVMAAIFDLNFGIFELPHKSSTSK